MSNGTNLIMASEKAHHNNRDLKRTGGHPIEDLIELMRRLREPETGCPWDLVQDFKTIAPYTIEEAYEVLDAIEREDMNALREELGDLILQPVYHAQMAAERGLFTIEDVITDVTEKMRLRHPHVFGAVDANDTEAVNAIWDQRKKDEKGTQESSALDGVTKALPALLHAQKILKKAMKAGFTWPDTAPVYDKVEEEISEFKEAVDSGNKEHMNEELGDVLLNIVILAQMHGFDAEESLRNATRKFERRFRGLESDLKSGGTALSEATLDQMMQAWRAQKQKERK